MHVPAVGQPVVSGASSCHARGAGRSWRVMLGSGLPANDEHVLVHVDEGSVRLIRDGERCSLA